MHKVSYVCCETSVKSLWQKEYKIFWPFMDIEKTYDRIYVICGTSYGLDGRLLKKCQNFLCE